MILVSPKGAGNVGGVARLMGNFGFNDLRIVDPRCNLQSVECKQMSMQAYSIIQEAKIFQTLVEAQADLHQSVALSAKESEVERPRADIVQFAARYGEHFRPDEKVGFVFGREETGLRLEELAKCNWQVDIPTTNRMPSMNLASAVAVALSMLHYHQMREVKEEKSKAEVTWPTKSKEEIFFARLFQLLERLKFLNPQNPQHLLEDMRAIYHRARMDDRDLRILFGLLASFEETLEGKNKGL